MTSHSIEISVVTPKVCSDRKSFAAVKAPPDAGFGVESR